MLKPTGEKIHLSVNVDHKYFMALDKITAKEALLIVNSCLQGNKEALDIIINHHNDNGDIDTMLYLSEVINAGIRNSV